jgi:GGDEF domain-containing protein
MWTDGIQSYYACFVGLIIFLAFVAINRVVPKRIRVIYYVQIALIFLCLIVTWLDYNFKIDNGNINKEVARTITLTISYALSPVAAALFAIVYIKHLNGYNRTFLILPFSINLVLLIVNIFTGIIFKVNANGDTIRGPIFFIPFLTCFIYMICLIYFSVSEKENRNKTYEIVIQSINTIIITSSVLLEIFLNLHFLLWPTIFIASIFYYIELSLQFILQDNLTGALSEVAFEYFLNINRGHSGVISLIDINDLSIINNKYGKDVGDSVLVACVGALLRTKNKKMFLYRMKDDQFVLVSRDEDIEDVNDILEKARENVSLVNGFKPTFAYGSSIFHSNDRLEEKIKDAQKIMEINKTHIKKVNIRD